MKWTPDKIRACKGKEKIISLTAYDYTTARLVHRVGVHILLVGDSLAMTVLGYENTLPVTIEEMLHHTRAVSRAKPDAMVIADMPFLSYQASAEQAILSGGRFLKEAAADAVKIEGGMERVEAVNALVKNGIPVMAHVGLTPQSVKAMGGYKVQGKTEDQAAELLKAALALEQAGAFCIVLEAMPSAVAKQISTALQIPCIGIGAGPDCDGQILVLNDILGLFDDFTPKFVKRYAELGKEIESAVSRYKEEVIDGSFPAQEHEY